jgi:hypothetical protein
VNVAWTPPVVMDRRGRRVQVRPGGGGVGRGGRRCGQGGK